MKGGVVARDLQRHVAVVESVTRIGAIGRKCCRMPEEAVDSLAVCVSLVLTLRIVATLLRNVQT